ncbi:CBS domain-containing protein [Flavobacterium agricola]|uniref:CBS domain-containing protein n=1 Tax=Flavobacterium agricola TaxID=2870839 RepID=A0ABY6M174_9FLAO|nr:CBS domain-containing protein [Flavobacterium agricola]UYW02276.1 CBS domain-containing protein [Flavobacterium agricola]
MKQRVPVSHIMAKGLLVITPNKKVSEAYQLLNEYDIRHLPVVEGTKLVGVISKNDLSKAGYVTPEMNETAIMEIYSAYKVEDIMVKNPVAITADTNIKEAAELLAQQSFHSLPVVDNNEVVGIITTTDLIKYLIDQY